MADSRAGVESVLDELGASPRVRKQGSDEDIMERHRSHHSSQ